MLTLDHVVYACNDIEEASNQYEDNFSVKSVKGGTHEGWGTYNYIAHFANSSYIEWLGISNYEVAKKSENPLIKHLVYTLENQNQGPFQFALGTTNLDSYIKHFDNENISYVGPIEGERMGNGGNKITWRMLFPKYDHTTEVLPFLIEWDQTSGEQLDYELINSQAVMPIYYGGLSMEQFLYIYDLPTEDNMINQVKLRNSSIIFGDNVSVTFELT